MAKFLFLSVALMMMPSLSLAQDVQLVQRYSCGKTCGKVRSCEEAVYQWCACGYRRADRDKDGVPCEKLCGQGTKSNRAKVKRIMKKLGCR